jgi:hypothetical protein
MTLAVAAKVGYNGGVLYVVASPTGTADDAVPSGGSGVDQTLTTPFPMLLHVTHVVDAVLTSTTVFSLPPTLSYVPGIVSSDPLTCTRAALAACTHWCSCCIHGWL